MNSQVILNVQQSQRLFERYKDQYPDRVSRLRLAPFTFNTNTSIPENLNQLSFFALRDPLLANVCYSTIFLDLLSRWIEHPEFDAQYKQQFDLHDFQISGSVIIDGFSKLINICDGATNFMEYYLQKNNDRILQTLMATVDTITNLSSSINPKELELILLSYNRILNYNPFKFKKFINPNFLYKILAISSEEFKVSKYLSILVLCNYFQSSEQLFHEYVSEHGLKNSDLISLFDGAQIDYKFLNVVELKRIANFHDLVDSNKDLMNSTNSKDKLIVIEPHQLSNLIKSIYGVLVPHLLPKDKFESTELVTTNGSVEVLKQLAQNIQNNYPTLLYGSAGSGKTFLFNQFSKLMGYENNIVKIHLGDQTDAKLLLGTYSSGEKPGTFKWRSGVLTTAVKEGKWVLIEDIDKAPTDVLSILLTLLEKRQLIIPSRGEVITANSNFQIISTVRTSESDSDSSDLLPDLIGLRLWHLIKVFIPQNHELVKILTNKFPLLKNLIKLFINCYMEILKIYSSHKFISLNRGSIPRIISIRDLIKFCNRCNQILSNNNITDLNQLLSTSIYDSFFQEAIDCFGSAITEYNALIPLVNVIGSNLEIPTSRINFYLNSHVPTFIDDEDYLKVGRSWLQKPSAIVPLKVKHSSSSLSSSSFAKTNHSLRLMEQISVGIQMVEPILLVGETGTGKTTVVQQVAKFMNKKLTVINVSQQTEAGDLLGGYKPINTKLIAIPLQEIFENLFITSFSRKKNEKFASILSKVFNKSQWKNVIKLWREAIKMAKELLKVEDVNTDEADKESENNDNNETNPKKKRRLKSYDRKLLLDQWNEFESKVKEFEIQSSALDNNFVFNFVEGSLVNAIRNGDWLLLDEINLASSDTLESISDLLNNSDNERSVLLSEKGDIEPIKAHPDFRIFGCMNPSTDIGKKDLPASIRSRFTEIYVHSPDRDFNDLLKIIDKYIGRFIVNDELVLHDIAELYIEAKNLSESNQVVDGANQKPHFSIRTLTRTLIYVADIISIYGLRRSLYEGFCMSFLTLLDLKSEKILHPIIEKYTISKLKNAKSVMSQIPPPPSKNPNDYVQFKHYWMKHGPQDIRPQPHYIITPFVEKNMLNLVRATAVRRFPVLIQGPTSAGKTSMINYLANITGHKFVRINNHEHTDLQEYLGTYVSDSTGKLTFKEGILVEAIRNGYWIVLDELNLAPTDILEALNRLLDDNRELFIPETQEVVRPHPDFMLFATQNPPGIYGGRKMLSRAFRNRFLELHFDDIPQDELEIILKERCQIAPSYCKRIVEVYKQLTVQRQSTRLFEQKNSFATLRDLFRWALREAIGYEELAANGYMLLAERVRKEDEKLMVKQTIEKVMKVKLDVDHMYQNLEEKALMNIESSIVWTKAMRRLAVLVYTAIKYKEPILLVGETGCGKTTICQVLAEFNHQELITVNAHQNTETSDILGAQRPVRNRFEIRSRLTRQLSMVLGQLGVDISLEDSKLEDLIKKFNSIDDFKTVDSEVIDAVRKDIVNSQILFEWNDGPLVNAMKSGNLFLLDEISLADDSVLERLNSVLEPERSLMLAEKGSQDAFIIADDNFQFLATMNPGGDYGKKELSPALRNRFTEIWVPSMNDFNDVRHIVENKLNPGLQHFTEAIVKFSEFYGNQFGSGNITSGVISLRDILAWIQFMNSSVTTKNVDPYLGLLHGACMVFIDSLGTNNTSYLTENEQHLKDQKVNCINKLSELVERDLLTIYLSDFTISIHDDRLSAGSFSIPRNHVTNVDDFLLHAPTTSINTMRVVRAMQVHKPILLEGSPGVGKTSLVSAIAKATGNNLIRINLSEQTDLVDLFGSDTPAEGGNSGEFVWRDAPFLRAMQRGEWVLLDEMNLASQSVLEGLNACLDHRGEAYIPELDKSFTCHPEFVVFAAQNPQYQGGGRKGLPKSFVNRFSVVYVDVLKKEDLNMISKHLFPNIESDICSKMIDFMSKIENEVVVNKIWGNIGGPWEFNLRDTLRWLDLYDSKSIASDLSPSDFLDMIICQRFRTSDDRSKARKLFESIFGKIHKRDNYFKIDERFIQVGSSIIERTETIQFSNHGTTNAIPLQCNYPFIENAIRCVNNNIPLILTGPSNSGKTELVRFLGKIVGAKVFEFAINSDIDSMDILGGYEQVDLTRAIQRILSEVKDHLQVFLLLNLKKKQEVMKPLVIQRALEFYSFVENILIDTSNFVEFFEYLNSFVSIHTDTKLQEIVSESSALLNKIEKDFAVKFEWFDGLLVQAVEKGYWLILDNANLCSPSVLDRLNSLLEVNGSLIVNECSLEDGQPRVLKPHPNFRLFLTVDPKYGELSRAMRNRGIELYLDCLNNRATSFDKKLLGIGKGINEGKKDNNGDIASHLEEVKLSNNSIETPALKHLSSINSIDASYTLLHDLFAISGKSGSMVSTVTGLIQFNMVLELNKWFKTIHSCDEFSEIDLYYAHELENQKNLIASEKLTVLNSLYSLYQPVEEELANIANKNLRYSDSQCLNPLINSSVLSELSQTRRFIDSPEPIFFFQVIGNIVSFELNLKYIEDKAMNGNMGDLNYIERSAAFKLGRNIKNIPRLNVFGLLEAIHNFFFKVFSKVAINEEIFKHNNIFESLIELHIIRERLLNTSIMQNESQIRVYRDLLSLWIQKNSNFNVINEEIRYLETAIKEFSSPLKLKTGFYMSELWEQFRAKYPGNENDWMKLVNLTKLFHELDKVSIEQHPDSFDQISSMKTTLLVVYDSIIDGTVSDEEFLMIVSNLQLGIEKLSSVTKALNIRRTNEFQSEFNLLSMFIESNQMMTENKDMSNIIRLSSFAGRPITQFIKSKNESLFIPYPTILENICTYDDNSYKSLISPMLDNSLSLNAITKSVNFSNTSGKLLQMKLNDLRIFAREFIMNSEYVLADIKHEFSELLRLWMVEMWNISHGSDFPPLNVDSLANEECYEQMLGQMPKEVASVFERFFFPSLKILSQSGSKSELGLAWIFFSCGAIQLYLPSSVYDPAIKEHVIYDKVMSQKRESEDLISSWTNVSYSLSGIDDMYALELISNNKEEGVNEPLKPAVYRSSSAPFDNLFEEWNAFMDSSVSSDQIERLLKSAENLNQESEQLIKMFQNNSSQFMLRLDTNFKLFADLNDILKGYVFGMKLGFDLVSAGNEETKKADINLLSVSDVSMIGNFHAVSKEFYKFVKFTKKQSPDNQITEKVMIYFMNVCFAHKFEVSSSVIESVLQTVYYRWSLRKLKEQEDINQSESLYKYNDPDVDIENDFKALFPDYDDVFDVDLKSFKNKQSFDEVYYKLAKSYVNALNGNQVYDLSSLVSEGNLLLASLDKDKDKFKQGVHKASNLVSTILNFSDTHYKYSREDNSNLDFYRESSPKETSRAIEIVNRIIASTETLLKEWPDHATLRDIHRVCNEFLDYPLALPIARQLQKIEQIYTFIAEWEKYAHSKVTLKSHFDQLTNLIVSWRRLELSTWKELFNHEDKQLEMNIGKWWFHLFESIVLPLYSGEQSSNINNLLSALNIFISQTTFGEFFFRLDLVRAFKNHVFIIEGKGETFNCISNFLKFYEQFSDPINARINGEKKRLEKEINEVILLASWKDVNIDALKQSARRSHASLYKTIRKYRSLLTTAVTPVIEEGLSDASNVSSPASTLLKVELHDIEMDSVKKICSQEVYTWSTRPSRLKDISLIEKNLKIYVNRIVGEDLPCLYEYTKELLEEMERLRNETPSTFKEDTKKLIASLKNEKAKLLSNTLKEFRRIGVKTTSKPEVKKAQSSSTLLLNISPSFEGTLMEGSDGYYFRVIELLPRLRSSMQQLPNDVPQPDIEKGFGVIENLVYSLLISRHPMVKFSDSITETGDLFHSFVKVSKLYKEDHQLAPLTITQSCKMNIDEIKTIIVWLSRIFDFAITAVNATGYFVENVSSSNVFYDLKLQLNKFEYELKQLDGVITDNSVSFVKSFNGFMSHMVTVLTEWSHNKTTFRFIPNMIMDWLNTRNVNLFINSSTSITDFKVVEDVDYSLRELSNSIILAVQKLMDVQGTTINEDDDNWFASVQTKLANYIKMSYHKNILNKLKTVLATVESIEHNKISSRISSAMVAFTLPMLGHYYQLLVSILNHSKHNYQKNAHSVFILSSVLYSIATKGFCSPEAPSDEKADENLKDGTGLGDGEGENNNSNDVDQDEDLDEQAQTENKEQDKDKNNDDENEDAVEMEGDMAGDLENASDQDKSDNEMDEEQDEMDEEVDDIDDLDQNEVDEKMWDEEAKENEKEKDSDKLPENKNQDDMVANEEDGEEGEEKEQDGEGNKDEKDEHDKEENDEEGDDEKDVGEQDDDVRNQENEQLEEQTQEADALELPEDMNLDGDDKDDEEGEDGQDNEDKFDGMDIEDEKEEKPENNEGNENDNNEEREDETENGMDEDIEDNYDESENDNKEAGDEANENEEEGNDVNVSEDEALGENEEKEDEKEGGQDADEHETAEGIDGADSADAHDDVDIESAVKQKAGEKGEGSDNQIGEEKEDIGASGGAPTTSQSQDPEQQKQEDAPQDDANDIAKESIKELGDALKEFHRRHQEIKEVSKTEDEVDERANERPDEFEHVDGENTNTDTQALGAADKDQMQSINDDMAIDDDDEEQNVDEEHQPEIKKEEPETLTDDQMEIEENKEEVNDEDPEGDNQGRAKGGFINDRTKLKEEEETGLMTHELDDEDMESEFDMKDEDVTVTDQDLAPIGIEKAREIWRQSEIETQELASGLCEQLRLILEPTLATKLKGDYKTGKRLNMKRIIPYIASEFRKDKIWLRRTKPSKRQYQVMIAVDDSKSMSESKSTELAFNSIALVSKALTQLESGGLSIVRFGEDVKVVHPFDKPFNNQESGPKIFQYFDFQQTKTDIKNLCNKSLKIFESAKINSNSDLWQLQIILSDGVCEDHATIQALVRRARESKIMLVFVVIDGINSNESILDMSQVRYEFDANGNSVLKVDKYLDSFPFEFYVVVRDINELPEMLSLILRQYFSEVASVSS